MTPTTATAPHPQEGGRTPSRRQPAAYRHPEEPRRMPPTQTRAARHGQARAADFIAAIYTWTGGPTAKDQHRHLNDAVRRIESAFRRDDRLAVIDGYRSRHGDPSGVRGNSELTGPEAAGFRLAEMGQPADEHHAAVVMLDVLIKRFLDTSVQIENQLRRIVSEPGQPPPAARLCSHCQAEPGDRETDVNGMLPGARFLGLRCIQFVERRQGAPNYGGRKSPLPTDAELRAMEQGKAPRARVNPKDTPFRWRDGTTTGINQPPPAA